jgi:hypothetical protein
MMRRVTFLLFILLLVSGSALAQHWQFVGLLPAGGVTPGDTTESSNIHGLAVDPAGKIWTMNYYAQPGDSVTISDYLIKGNNNSSTGPDSILVAKTIAVRAIHVYNSNGTKASFSPIIVLNMPGSVKDTIGFWRLKGTLGNRYNPSASPNSNRGMRRDQNGNILAVIFGQIYRINYQTGAGMAKVVVDSANSMISPGVDANGDIFITRVSGGGAAPIKIYDTNFNYIENAKDTTTGFARSITVSPNGNDVYYADYTSHRFLRLHSNSGTLGTYAVRDTILRGFDCESMDWNPKSHYLWASAGSFNDLPNRYPGTTTGYTPGAWYAVDTGTLAIKDSLIWKFSVADTDIAGKTNQRPRAIAFSTGGDTAYVGVFGGPSVSQIPGIRVYTHVLTAVEKVKGTQVPTDYSLEQNYPNPFNPSTVIQFTIAKAGATALVLYDMLGRQIGTLMYENLQPGTYKYNLNATMLPSGTYIYELRSGSARLAKKMVLLK